MNMHNPLVGLADADARPSKAEAEAAARTLLRWAGGEPSGIGALDLTAVLGRRFTYPVFNRG